MAGETVTRAARVRVIAKTCRGHSPCVLAATTASNQHVNQLFYAVGALCLQHAWVRVLVNFYDEVLPDHTPHPRVWLTQARGFKSLFWKLWLLPSALEHVTHLFLFDEDMEIHPQKFDLLSLVRIHQVSNVSILAPAPYGQQGSTEPGMYPYNAAPFSGKHDLIGPCVKAPLRNCGVCRQPVVELKAPLFDAEAWRIVHSRMLSILPSSLLTGPVIDMYWCGLLEQARHCPRFLPAANCSHRLWAAGVRSELSWTAGGACAYSYLTPMLHLDYRSLDVWMHRNTSRKKGGLGSETEYRRNALVARMNRDARFRGFFWAMPSWRPKDSILETDPCLSNSRLASALADWSVDALPPITWHLNFTIRSWAWRRARALVGTRKSKKVGGRPSKYGTKATRTTNSSKPVSKPGRQQNHSATFFITPRARLSRTHAPGSGGDDRMVSTGGGDGREEVGSWIAKWLGRAAGGTRPHPQPHPTFNGFVPFKHKR